MTTLMWRNDEKNLTRLAAVLAAVCLLAAVCACDDEPKGAEPKPADASAQPASSPAATETAKEEAAAPRLREGNWKAKAAGRGVAYEVTCKKGKVVLDMGGRLFEGTAKDGGRTYTTSSSEYVIQPTDSGFELHTKDKPTWTVSFSKGTVALTSGDKKLEIVKEGEGLAVKRGDEVLGEVASDGEKVEVKSATGKTKYTGDDGLVAAWGVLILEDIGQPMRRLLFTELLARGR
jgi:hypothetical protein